jgi:hypothetical protein
VQALSGLSCANRRDYESSLFHKYLAGEFNSFFNSRAEMQHLRGPLFSQCGIESPESARGKQRRGQQMSADPANALPPQSLVLNDPQDFFVRRGIRAWEFPQKLQNLSAVFDLLFNASQLAR